MLNIAICEDNPIHANCLKEKIEGLLDVPFVIHMFISGNNFLQSCKKNDIDYDIYGYYTGKRFGKRHSDR